MKRLTKVLISFLAGIIVTTIIYLMGAFTEATFDINVWDILTRRLVATMGGLFMLTVTGLFLFGLEADKDDVE